MKRPRSNRGATLLIALLLLSAMALLGLIAAANGQLQSRLAAMSDDDVQALAIAEATLARGEFQLLALPAEPRCNDACLPSIHSPGALPPEAEQGNSSWWQSNGLPSGTANGRFAIQDLALSGTLVETPQNETRLYRVLAWHVPESGEPVVIESLVARSWGPDEPLCERSEAQPPCGRLAWRRHR